MRRLLQFASTDIIYVAAENVTDIFSCSLQRNSTFSLHDRADSLCRRDEPSIQIDTVRECTRYFNFGKC